MSRKELARLLVMQKAVLDVLRDADQATRREARETYEGGDADQVGDLGRVRMDKGRTSWKVTDRAAFERWVAEHHPDAIIQVPTVTPAFEKQLLRDGADQDGEIPDGLEEYAAAPRLVVTTTNDAAVAARSILTPVLEVES